MRCDDARLALSSRLDGEATNAGEGEVNAHLSGCATCRTWLAGAERVTRAVRVQSVQVPDLTARILQAVHADGSLQTKARGDRFRAALRWLLGGLAVLQLMLAVPELLGAVGHDAHAGREVAAFDIALAVGLLLVACYPEHARIFAPVALTLVFCFASISALDVVQGVVTPGRVAIHGIAALQALLVWRLARGTRAEPATV